MRRHLAWGALGASALALAALTHTTTPETGLEVVMPVQSPRPPPPPDYVPTTTSSTAPATTSTRPRATTTTSRPMPAPSTGRVPTTLLLRGTVVKVPLEAQNAIARYFRPHEYAKAVYVMGYESGFELHAANPTSSARGPWQWLKGSWPEAARKCGEPTDLAQRETWNVSTRVSACWVRHKGWGAWVTAKNF